MSKINLLLRLYFEEAKEEGFTALRNLLSQANGAELTIVAGASRRRLSGIAAQIDLPEPFNIVEGVLMFGAGDGTTAQTEVDVRYRPSIASRFWRTLDIPPGSSLVDWEGSSEAKDSEPFQLLLSLTGFEKSALALGARNGAVFELLCCSIHARGNLAETISKLLLQLCPELLAAGLWGYGDTVPFRQLSVEEEWQVARTDLLWGDLAATADAQHQYLLRTLHAAPKVTVPEVGIREGQLVIHKL